MHGIRLGAPVEGGQVSFWHRKVLTGKEADLYMIEATNSKPVDVFHLLDVSGKLGPGEPMLLTWREMNALNRYHGRDQSTAFDVINGHRVMLIPTFPALWWEAGTHG